MLGSPGGPWENIRTKYSDPYSVAAPPRGHLGNDRVASQRVTTRKLIIPDMFGLWPLKDFVIFSLSVRSTKISMLDNSLLIGDSGGELTKALIA